MVLKTAVSSIAELGTRLRMTERINLKQRLTAGKRVRDVLHPGASVSYFSHCLAFHERCATMHAARVRNVFRIMEIHWSVIDMSALNL